MEIGYECITIGNIKEMEDNFIVKCDGDTKTVTINKKGEE